MSVPRRNTSRNLKGIPKELALFVLDLEAVLPGYSN